MKVAIIADAFPPMRTSGAIQIKDLADEFINQGQSRDCEYYLIKYYKPSLNKLWVTTGLSQYDTIQDQ